MAPLVLAFHLALASTGAASQGAAAAAPPRDAEPDGGAAVLDVATATPVPPTTAASLAPAAAPRGRLAAITLVPRELDPGPFRPGEMAGATLGAFAGDAIVLGLGYLALQAFANGTLSPNATNFRRAVYVLGVSALVVPPLTAVLLAKLTGGPHGRGAFWKAMLLASAGELAALAAGYYAAPRFWIVLPVQAVTLSIGASLGLHWGSRGGASETREATPDAGRERPAPPPDATAVLAAMPLCTES